jgi:hypothetical protein
MAQAPPGQGESSLLERYFVLVPPIWVLAARGP